MKVMACLLVLATLLFPSTGSAAGPTRISFKPGATSAGVTGQLAAGKSAEYVLRASAGQIMQVGLDVNAVALLAIRGADGAILKPAPDGQHGWQGKLPKTQDYFIKVTAGNAATWYCLRTTVFARIQFAKGGTSATVTSPMENCVAQWAEQVGGYVLRASAGQKMRTVITSPNGNVYLTVVGPGGALVKSFDDWLHEWEGTLPATGDYQLLPLATGPDTKFTLSVTIPPLAQNAPVRIRFAPGATSGQVSGVLEQGHPDRYVLGAAKGQRMEIRIWPTPTGYVPPVLDVSVTGPGGVAWRDLGLNPVIGSLPATGDYVIKLALKPGSPGCEYLMEVVIPAR
jgi:hypothetical protein